MTTLQSILKDTSIYVMPYPQFQLAGLARQAMIDAGYHEDQIVELTNGEMRLRFKNQNTYENEYVIATEEIQKQFVWTPVNRPVEDYEFRMYHAPLTKEDITCNGKYSLD